MIDFKDLDDGLAGAKPAPKMTEAELRAKANMVNGGEQAMVPCHACGGSGSWRGRGICFRCKGNGRISKRSAAASKARETRERNLAEKLAAIRETPEYAYVEKRAGKGSTFYASILDKVNTYGDFSEKVEQIIHNDMAKDAAFYEAKRAEREAAKPKVDITEINKLFAKAVSNDIKRPVYRAEGVVISQAPEHGRNAGALYVKSEGGTYLGKIAEGKFHGAWDTDKEGTARALMVIAEDPTAASIRYGRKTGNCGCCGHPLVNPVSIRSGVGPICADNWGLNWRRDAAEEELAVEREEEEAKRARGEVI